MALTEKSYLSIKPGETKILKKNVKILSVINYGGVNYNSTCNDFSDKEEAAACYKLRWSTAREKGADGTSTPLYRMIINYMEILGTRYIINKDPEEEVGSLLTGMDTDKIQTYLTTTIPQSLIKISDLTYWAPGSGRRYEFTLYFQSIPSIAETIEMKLSETAHTGYDGSFVENGLFVKPILIDCGELPVQPET